MPRTKNLKRGREPSPSGTSRAPLADREDRSAPSLPNYSPLSHSAPTQPPIDDKLRFKPRNHLISLNVGPVGIRESLLSLLPIFKRNPAVVMTQECRLRPSSIASFRRYAHKLLPHYCIFYRSPRPVLRTHIFMFLPSSISIWRPVRVF
jgi:hypothetical protein